MALTERSRNLRKNSTEAEKILWEKLRDHRFHGFQFRRQHPIGKRYILDFYCPENKFAIEVDGGIHLEPEIADYDKFREAELSSAGITILRVTNEEVFNGLEQVLKKIKLSLEPPLST